VILVTGLSRLDSNITEADQVAMRQVAERIGQKLDTEP